MEQHLMEQVSGNLAITLLEIVLNGVDNNSLTHTDNRQNEFLVLSDDTFGINGSFGAPGKNFSINSRQILLELALQC